MAVNLLNEVSGLPELLATLENISQDMKKKGGRSALRKASLVVKNAVKESVQHLDDPGTPEQISKNITVRWSSKLFRRTGDLGFRVGVLGGARQYSDTSENRRARRVGARYFVGGSSDNPGGDTFYWRFLEFGTQKIAARPFMRRALEENTGAATQVFVTEYRKALERALRRQSRT